MEMKKVIQQDMTKLKDAMVGAKQGYKANGYFLKLPGLDRCVYSYQHMSEHATCSKTLFSQLEGCLQIESKKGNLPSCPDLFHHKCLLPFYHSNEHVLELYKCAQTTTDSQLEIDQLEKIVSGKEADIGTPFESPSPFTFNWQENDWTKRLVYGIKKLLPQRQVTYTAEMGLRWHIDLLKCLGVGHLAYADSFLFRGAPDIIIGKKSSVTTGLSGNTQDDSSSEDENSFQRTPMQGATRHSLPEKIGEVFAGLHILLISRILKTLAKKKPIDVEHKVQGILIDKICGVIHCFLSVEMREGAAALHLKVTDFSGCLLDPSHLCSHLRLLNEPKPTVLASK